eukprot:TRINITY_DN348_c0_g2_i7.p1 TRINITY_DN348_c0_g2~~TRINITY_DN348_c0_g2_i7.p1  ORF type:complete len:388 (-),score=81.94 TRINITY_DN348_c0_g2_i7:451-1572(-)
MCLLQACDAARHLALDLAPARMKHVAGGALCTVGVGASVIALIFQTWPIKTVLQKVVVDPVWAALYFSRTSLLRGLGVRQIANYLQKHSVHLTVPSWSVPGVAKTRVASKTVDEEEKVPDVCPHCNMPHFAMDNHLCQSMSVVQLRQHLEAGNTRYVEGHLQPHCHDQSFRRKLNAGQQPAVAVVSCADSRCDPNLVLDALEGEMFVCRVAGNYVDTGVAGSLQFACQHLGTKMVIICGHTKCGAIHAATWFEDPGKDEKEAPLVTLVRNIRAGLEQEEEQFGDYTCKDDSDKKLRRFQTQVGNDLVAANVVEQMGIMKHVLEDIPGVAVVGAVFCIESGRIEFLDQYVHEGINMRFSTGQPVEDWTSRRLYD